MIYLVVREEHHLELRTKPKKSTEKIFNERYAKGEITTEEYKKIKKQIRK